MKTTMLLARVGAVLSAVALLSGYVYFRTNDSHTQPAAAAAGPDADATPQASHNEPSSVSDSDTLVLIPASSAPAYDRDSYISGSKSTIAISPVDLAAATSGQKQTVAKPPAPPQPPAPQSPQPESKAVFHGSKAPLIISNPPSPAPQEDTLAVRLQGPTEMAHNQSADFTITIENKSKDEISPVRIVSTFDADLKPTHASAGFTLENAGLNWKIETLKPGQSLQFQVRAQAQRIRAGLHACCHVTVTADDQPREESLCVAAKSVAPPILPGQPQPNLKQSPAEGKAVQPAARQQSVPQSKSKRQEVLPGSKSAGF